MRSGQVVQADVPDRRFSRADDDRGPVEQEAIDEIGGEESGSGLGPAFDEQVLDVRHRGNGFGRRQRSPSDGRAAPRQHPAGGAARFQSRQAHVEPGPVRPQGAAADQDRVGSRALRVAMGARRRPGDPAACAVGKGDLAIERRGEFQCDLRAAVTPAHQISGQAGFGGRRTNDPGGEFRPLRSGRCPRLRCVGPDRRSRSLRARGRHSPRDRHMPGRVRWQRPPGSSSRSTG